MADIRTRRMLKERVALEKEMTDYVCFFDDENIFSFFVYLTAPEDSVYRWKLLKLKFEIPSRYPLVPPKVKFIQHRGERIHPNLYVEGKLCLSILGTWPGEPWAFSMTTDGVLRTVQSLLDNAPYMHEPGQSNHPEFNEFVRFTTWRWLLLDYLENETHPGAKAWLHQYIAKNADKMTADLSRQEAIPGPPTGSRVKTVRKTFNSRPYKPKEIAADFTALNQDLQNAIQASKKALQLSAEPNPDTSGAVSALPESNLETSTTTAAKHPMAAGAIGVLQGGPPASGPKQKRKFTTEDEKHLSGPQAQSHASATQQAKGSVARQSEISPKRPKKDPEVIDLT
ncbi:unnamed protein product [Discula destructiva]